MPFQASAFSLVLCSEGRGVVQDAPPRSPQMTAHDRNLDAKIEAGIGSIILYPISFATPFSLGVASGENGESIV